MNWNQLQYVVTIAEEKSITKAAKKLFISQPSLSVSIQSLEKETGVTIFERNHNEICLTYAGTLFYEWAVSTLNSHQQLNLKLNDIADSKRRLIRIGLSPHRSSILLPTILEKFFAEFPDCEVHTVEQPTHVLKELLERNELDFMIDVAHPDTFNFQSDFLIDEKIMLAVPAAFSNSFSPEAKKEGTISLSEMAPYPFIMLSPDHVLGAMSRKMCEAASFHPDIRITCFNMETTMALAGKQLGIAFVLEFFAKHKRFYPDLQYFHIKPFNDTRQICLVYRRNLYQHTQLRALLRYFREMVPSLYSM